MGPIFLRKHFRFMKAPFLVSSLFSLLVSLLCPWVSSLARAETHPLTLLDRDGWNIVLSGFAELDVITDSTRSFTEVAGSSPVDRPTTVSGAGGRTQFSIRNSRLAFNVLAPAIDSWKTRGYIETDFLGFDPNPPGASGVGNNEAGLYNSPTMRVRHAYLQATSDGFQVTAGQTWQLFGWQPYYFVSTDQVAPIVGMAYSRTSQIRVMQTITLGENAMNIQMALSASRPPERDGLYPDVQGGLRIAFPGRTAAFTGGSSGPVKNQPLSLGVSGLARNILIPSADGPGSTINNLGSAIAGNILIPVLASPDGVETGNTLALLAEYTVGSGYGDQFAGWTGNMANPLSSSKVNPSSNLNLDAGIGDYDSAGRFHLVKLSTFNVHFQYHLPEALRTFLDVGVAQLYSANVNDLLPSKWLSSAGKTPYNRTAIGFTNIFHNFTDQIRVGIEFAHTETTYADGNMAFNNRYQLTTQFIF